MEKKKKSAKELCNAIIPILGTSSSIEVLRELFIRDLIIIWTESMRMVDSNDGIPPVAKEIRRKFSSDLSEIFQMISKKLLQLEEGFYLEDRNTKCPYINSNGHVPIFVTPDQAAEYLLKKGKNGYYLQTTRIQDDNIESFLRQCFYIIGAFGVFIYVNEHYMEIPAVAFFENPGLPNETEETNIHLNPDFMRNLCLFEHELKKDNPNEDLFSLWESALCKELKKAVFVIPVKTNEENKSTLITPILNGENNQIRGLPIFTDWLQFATHFNTEEWNGAYYTAEELLKYSAKDYFVINFKTNNLTFSRARIKDMLSR